MADKEKKSTMKGFATNDQADYYSGIRSIRVNGNNYYELNGKFLDDLHINAFSGTNEKDAVECIEYFLKIVGDAWRWFDGIKGSITSWVNLTDNFFGKYHPHSRTAKV
ncbi:hypothetical protein Tco_0043047, partial [Tanacetum coccineum]